MVAATLIMELSSVPLNFLHCTIQNHLFIMAVQLTFMLTFFFARLVVVPWLWYGWVKTYYETVIVGGSEVRSGHGWSEATATALHRIPT